MGLELEEGDLDMAGVVERDLLGEGIARGIFEVVPVLKAVLPLADDDIGLVILDDCGLLDVIDVVVPTLECRAPRNNKHFFLTLVRKQKT